jgi:hypothetical protein
LRDRRPEEYDRRRLAGRLDEAGVDSPQDCVVPLGRVVAVIIESVVLASVIAMQWSAP